MNMKVDLCGVTLNNPVMTASGTFGSGAEYAEFVDLNKLGAVVTKGVANVPWPGNPTPRVAEVYGGMLNAVGLQNPGIDLFVERDIPFLKQFDTKIIVNVCGHSTEEYIEVVDGMQLQLNYDNTDYIIDNSLTDIKLEITIPENFYYKLQKYEDAIYDDNGSYEKTVNIYASLIVCHDRLHAG